MFVLHCRHHKIGHSQTRFTAAKIGWGEKAEETFPCLKAKAANARHICHWLYGMMPASTPAVERCLFWGLSKCLHLLHGAEGPSFDAADKTRFVHAGKTALLSYSQLTRIACRDKVPLWPLKPKHHQLAHAVKLISETSRVPGWCFADEDFNRLVARTIRTATYNPSLGKRSLLVWSLRLRRTFDVDESAVVLSDSSDSDREGG